jgi:hypothetical protein
MSVYGIFCTKAAGLHLRLINIFERRLRKWEGVDLVYKRLNQHKRILVTTLIIALTLSSLPFSVNANPGGPGAAYKDANDTVVQPGGGTKSNTTTGTLVPDPPRVVGIDVSLVVYNDNQKPYDLTFEEGTEWEETIKKPIIEDLTVWTGSHYPVHGKSLHFVEDSAPPYGKTWRQVYFQTPTGQKLDQATIVTGSGGTGLENHWGPIIQKRRAAKEGKLQLTVDEIMGWIESDNAVVNYSDGWSRSAADDVTMMSLLFSRLRQSDQAAELVKFAKADDDELATDYYMGLLVALARTARVKDKSTYDEWVPMLETYFGAVLFEKQSAYTNFKPLLVSIESTTMFSVNQGTDKIPYMLTVQGLMSYELGNTGWALAQRNRDADQDGINFVELYSKAHDAVGKCATCKGGAFFDIAGIYNNMRIHFGKLYQPTSLDQQGVLTYNPGLHTDSGLIGLSYVGAFVPVPYGPPIPGPGGGGDPGDSDEKVYLSGRSGITVNPKAKLVEGNPFTEDAEIEIDLIQNDRDKGNWEVFFRYLDDKNYTNNVQMRVFLKGEKGEDPSKPLTESDVQPAAGNLIRLTTTDAGNGGEWSDVTLANLRKLIDGETTLKYIHVIENDDAPSKWTYAQGVQIKVPGITFINLKDPEDPSDDEVNEYNNMMFRQEPRTDFASFIIENDDIHYYSKYNTPYAEIKEGYVDKSGKSVENFNAMTGTPTTETLFFASGGSEFVVQMDGEIKVGSATRTYTNPITPGSCPDQTTYDDEGGVIHQQGHPVGSAITWTQTISNIKYLSFKNLKVWQLKESRVTNMQELIPTDDDGIVKGKIEANGPFAMFNNATANTAAQGRLYHSFHPEGLDHYSGFSPIASENLHSPDSANRAKVKAARTGDMDTVTVVSDYLILNTSNGVQCITYYEYTASAATSIAEGNVITLQDVPDEEIWKTPKYASSKASNYKENDVTYGGYTGQWEGGYSEKYTSYGGAGNMSTATLGTLTIAKPHYANASGTAVGESVKTTVDKGFRLVNQELQPSNTTDNDDYNTENGEYKPQNSTVFYELLVNAGPEKAFHGIQPQEAYDGQNGFVLQTTYSPSHNKINNVVIHDPVSVQYARVISLPDVRDQRTSEYKNIEPLRQHIFEGCPGVAENCAYSYVNCDQLGPDAVHTAECFTTVTRTRNGPNNDHGSIQYWGWDSTLQGDGSWAAPAFVGPVNDPYGTNTLIWTGTSQTSWNDPVGFAWPGSTAPPDASTIGLGVWMSTVNGQVSIHQWGSSGESTTLVGNATLYETDDYWEWGFWPDDTDRTGTGFRLPYYRSTMFNPVVMIWHGTAYTSGHDAFYFALGDGNSSTQYAVFMNLQTGAVYYSQYSGGYGGHLPQGTTYSLGTATRMQGTYGIPSSVGPQPGPDYKLYLQADHTYYVWSNTGAPPYSANPSCSVSSHVFVEVQTGEPLVRWYKAVLKPTYSFYQNLPYGSAPEGTILSLDAKGYLQYNALGYFSELSLPGNTKQTAVDTYTAALSTYLAAKAVYDAAPEPKPAKPTEPTPPQIAWYKVTSVADTYDSEDYVDKYPWQQMQGTIWIDERTLPGNTKAALVDAYWNVHTLEGEEKFPETRSYNVTFNQLVCDDPHHALTSYWAPYTKGMGIVPSSVPSPTIFDGRNSTNFTDGSGSLAEADLVYFRGTDTLRTVATIKSAGYIVLHDGQYHLTVDTNKCDYCGTSIPSGTRKWHVSETPQATGINTIEVGSHYPKGDSRCWAPCLDDSKHSWSPYIDDDGNEVDPLFPNVTSLGLDTTSYTPGNFLNLDYAFKVYYPNIGDFAVNPSEQFSFDTSQFEGWGYTSPMTVTKWTKAKYIRFPFDVVWVSAGSTEKNLSYPAGTDISLDVWQTDFVFYVTLTNTEMRDACIEFWSIALNNPYDARDMPDTLLNKERGAGLAAKHSAYKEQYLDVVGRIGALTVEDTGDMRFSNFFKMPTSPVSWRVNQIIKDVDITKQNYLMVDPVDIRGHEYTDPTGTHVDGYEENRQGALDTYSARTERSDVLKLFPMPVVPSQNNIAALQRQPVRIGYDAFLDLMTLGTYYGDNVENSVVGDDAHQVQIIPYYYHVNLDTGEWVMVDVYYSKDGIYRLINKFASGDTPPFSPPVYLNWRDEQERRNYQETSETTGLGEVVRTNLINELYNSVIPFGPYYEFGTYASYHLKARNRTYIGYEVQNGKYRDPSNVLSGITPVWNGQRWHFTQGLPSSAVVVEAGLPATQANIDALANKNGVIAVALNIIAHGMVFDLEYDGQWINVPFELTPEGPTIDPAYPNVRPPTPNGPDEPKQPGKDPVVIVYTDDRSSKDDLRVEGTQ